MKITVVREPTLAWSSNAFQVRLVCSDIDDVASLWGNGWAVDVPLIDLGGARFVPITNLQARLLPSSYLPQDHFLDKKLAQIFDEVESRIRARLFDLNRLDEWQGVQREIVEVERAVDEDTTGSSKFGLSPNLSWYTGKLADDTKLCNVCHFALSEHTQWRCPIEKLADKYDDGGCECNYCSSCPDCGEYNDDCACNQCSECGYDDDDCHCCHICGHNWEDCPCCPVCSSADYEACGCCQECESREGECECNIEIDTK